MQVLGKFIKIIRWFIDTFKVAISIILVIMVLSLIGCTNLESLVRTEKNVSRETSLLRIGEKKWPTENEGRVISSVSLGLLVRARESIIILEVVAV